MFRVFFKGGDSCSSAEVTLVLQGCPESGLPAIDWRRARGFSDEPTNVVTLVVDRHSEAVCRAFPDLLTSQADLVGYSLRDKLGWTTAPYERTAVQWKLVVESKEVVGGINHPECDELLIQALYEIITKSRAATTAANVAARKRRVLDAIRDPGIRAEAEALLS